MTRPLRIAVPKGRLLQQTLELFDGAGVDVPNEEELRGRRLVFERESVEWILVKDADVPVYVEFGAADIGVSGLDQILEHGSDVLQSLDLDFGRCRMMLIGAAGITRFDAIPGAKIATKYPNVAREFLRVRRRHFDIVPLQGSVELAAVLNLAPYIIDLVETGETIRVHGLRPLELVAEIAPRVIVNRSSWAVESQRIQRIVSALEGAMQKETVA